MNQSPMPPMMPGASPMSGGMPLPQWLIDIFRYGIGKQPPPQQQNGVQMPARPAADIPSSFFNEIRDFPGLLQLLSQPRPNALPKDLRE